MVLSYLSGADAVFGVVLEELFLRDFRSIGNQSFLVVGRRITLKSFSLPRGDAGQVVGSLRAKTNP